MNRRRLLQALAAAVLTVAAEPPGEAIPRRFWLPEQIPKEWKVAWTRRLPPVRDYYDRVTRPFLASSEIPEYLPPYMRE